jgi:hypothetical protein
MSITVDGQECASQEIRIIDGRPTLVVTMASVSAPVVNEVEYPEFEYHVVNGHATLHVPFGEKLPETRSSEQQPFTPDFSSFDEMDKILDRILPDASVSLLERPPATVVDLADARARYAHPSRKPRATRPSRIGFTPRPIS